MALRIHFSSEDFPQTRLAQAPDPLWEVLLSLHMLQTGDGPLVFDQWRRRTRARLDGSMRQLLALAPPRGYSPDFLTPAAATGGLEAGIGAVLSTPRARLREDLVQLAVSQRRMPPGARLLAEGDPRALDDLGEAIRAYHRVALAPYWSRLRSDIGSDLAARTRAAATGSDAFFDHLLRTLHPGLHWERPVLTMLGTHVNGDLHLGGRGLLLLPSYFCWRKPTMLRNQDLPPVVVYPVEHATGRLLQDPAGQGGLAALLGRTRAVLLETIAEGSTTTELARSADIAAATASHHLTVLREAGLVVTRRVGGSAHHTLTPLGAELLVSGGTL